MIKIYDVRNEVINAISQSDLGNRMPSANQDQNSKDWIKFSFYSNATLVRNIVLDFILFLWLITKSDFNNLLPIHSRHDIEYIER